MEASFFERHPMVKDALSIAIFIICVIIGTLLINSYVFRSFGVQGPSMQDTLFTGDRLIVNRVPVTWAHIMGKDYQPKRGQIIVFKNPLYQPGDPDQYIVKRVIAFGGEQVQVKNGHLTVFNKQNPNGFDPDEDNNGEPLSPTSGDVDKETVPDDTLFVSGDNRIGDNSLDSRSGLGFIPLYDVIGPVSLRIYPFNKIRTFSNEGAKDASSDPKASAAAAKELTAN